MSENGKQAYFNGLAGRWDSFPAMEDAPRKVRRYVEHSGKRSAASVLDAGCGTGILLPDILDWFSDASVVEADFALNMLQENARKIRDRRVVHVCTDVMRLPAPPNSFDLVLCFGILPHLEDRAAALAEFLRVLKPGGALSVGHLVGSKELNAFHSTVDGPVSHDMLPTSVELAHSLAQAGAVKIQTEEDSGWYFVRAEKPAC